MILLGPDRIRDLSKVLKYKSPKSVKENINRLITLNWIGKDKRSGYYFIRGFDSLLKEMGSSDCKRVRLFVSNINKLKPFIVASIIGDIINKQRWIEKQELAQYYKGRAFQAHARSISNFQPIANRYLAQVLSISPSTAHEYKKEASLAGFISIKPDITPLGITPYQAPYYFVENPEKETKMRSNYKSGYIHLRNADLVASKITFVKGKKPINNIKGLIGENRIRRKAKDDSI